jgi:hypothetical protein
VVAAVVFVVDIPSMTVVLTEGMLLEDWLLDVVGVCSNNGLFEEVEWVLLLKRKVNL